MTDYSDLIKRLRRDGIAARDTLKCAELAPTVDPEDSLEAADAIEHLMKEIDVLDDHWRKDKARIAELEAAFYGFKR